MTLHTEHRPTSFEGVVGHSEVTESLEAMFEENEVAHAFLFTGPSGVGKTTLARIIAERLDCVAADIMEFDAATHSGVADIRQVTEVIHYHTFDDRKKMIIIDECHALSSQAWQALLKPIEEPPEHIYFVFCTTLPAKVPQTIRTRCHAYNLSEVPPGQMMSLLEEVADLEDIGLEDWQLDAIARASDGSPRQALVYLDMCRNVQGEDEFYRLLLQPGESPEVIDLCRFLGDRRGRNWLRAQTLLLALKDVNPESVRAKVSAYMLKCVLGTKSEDKLADHLMVLDHFSRPVFGMDGIVLAVFAIVFDSEEA